MEQTIFDFPSDKYAVYKYTPNDEFCAVKVSDTNKLRNLAMEHYNNPSGIPIEEMVEVVSLSYNSMKRTYSLLENIIKKVPVRDLIPIPVRLEPDHK